jgi:hypothetical protein
MFLFLLNQALLHLCMHQCFTCGAGNVCSDGGIENVAKGALAVKAVNLNLYFIHLGYVRHVTGNDQDYLGESPEWLFRYLRFSKRATVGVRATYATR